MENKPEKCLQRGCRNLETKCSDCGRIVNTATFKPIGTEWISVKDRLPPLDIKVLFCDTDGWMYTGYNAEDGFETACGEECGTKVAYWMPLPKLPEDK